MATSGLGAVNFGNVGSAVGDLFNAGGTAAEGAAYGDAATYATQNAQVSAESTAIKEYQANRAVYQQIGKGAAAAGANGLTGGGSASDILRASASQGALQQQVIGEQGIIDETSYKEQAAQYTGMQQAAQATAAAQTASGIGGLIGGALSFFGL